MLHVGDALGLVGPLVHGVAHLRRWRRLNDFLEPAAAPETLCCFSATHALPQRCGITFVIADSLNRAHSAQSNSSDRVKDSLGVEVEAERGEAFAAVLPTLRDLHTQEKMNRAAEDGSQLLPRRHADFL